MNVAFLFNSDHPALGGCYGGPVMELILATNVLQQESRSMRVSYGDILTYSIVSQSKDRSHAALDKLCRAVYKPASFDRINRPKLEATYTTATVYCWLFQNMTKEVAEKLDSELQSADFYLGCMDVTFSRPLHLLLFRNNLIEAFRITGTKCDIFYSMGLNEDPNVCDKEVFERAGFEVEAEDLGARRTFFDKYNSSEHFKRVESFRSFCSKLPALTDNDASAIIDSLEELHPKLFDALAAAARTLERAETEEDYAQAALSGRRLLERTADALFPPQKCDWKGRKVGTAQYKNRLWAYIDTALSSIDSPTKSLETLGKETDRLIELFNSGLHASPTQEKIELAFRDLIIWLRSVLEINPSMARDPYRPYGLDIDELMRSILTDISDQV